MLTELLLTILTIAVVGILFFFAQIRKEIVKYLKTKNTCEVYPSADIDLVPKKKALGVNEENSAQEIEPIEQTVETNPPVETQPVPCQGASISTRAVPFGAVPKASQTKTSYPTKIYNYFFCNSSKSAQKAKIASWRLKNINVKKRLLENLVQCSNSPDHLPIYKLNIFDLFSDPHTHVRKSEIVTSKNGKYGRNEKVIMILGATGSGKTTLINSMINYIIGVEYNDPFRFKLISEEDEGRKSQADSQTSWITAYTIHHQEGFNVPYTLTIIDTPGYGDSSGIQRDMEITKQIHSFFTVTGPNGIDRIDAVGFVIQSSLPRLTPTQQYIFDQILALFGKDIGENIYLMLTFADGKKPQVLSGINKSGLPYQEFFKFNNSVIFEDTKTGDEFDKMFWKMGMQSFENFFRHFHRIVPKSLTQTKSVLEERETIEIQVAGLQFEIRLGLSKLEQLKKEVEVVEQHKAEIARNENFFYTVEEDTTVKQELEPGTFVTNCLTCNFTCHNPCSIPDDENKYKCAAMDRKRKDISDIYCRICPQKCYWKNHKNMQFYYTTERKEVTKTSANLLQRYQDANGKMMKTTEIVKEMTDEFQAVQLKVIGITEILRKSITKLNEIALKPNPLSTPEYVDILIESERASAQPGWQDRVSSLYEVKEKVKCLAEVLRQGYDPFEYYKIKIEEEKKTEPGTWSAVGDYLKHIKFW